MYRQHLLTRASRLALGILLAAGVAGCVTEQPPTPAGVRTQQRTTVDECSNNLHELAGYLLQYGVIHKRLPQGLEELRSLVDTDKALPLACPISNQPYLYIPNGLEAPKEPNRIVLLDPQPSHNGKRWAIVMAEPQETRPLGLWVIQIAEADLGKYHPSTPQ